MPEKYTTLGGSTLDGAITDTATTLDVADAISFPSTGRFRIKIEDEIIIVDAVSSNTFSSLTRGAEGTTAATHADGVDVIEVVTAGSLDAIRTDLASSGTLSSRPSTLTNGVAGVPFWLNTDWQTLNVREGSSWKIYGPIHQLTDPTLQTWSWVNQSTGSVSEESGGGILLTGAAGAGNNNMQFRVHTAPSTPYTVTALLAFTGYHANFPACGIGFRESSTGKLIIFGNYFNNGGPHMYAGNLNSPTSINGNINDNYYDMNPTGYAWLQLTDNGTNLLMNYSHDGLSFNNRNTVSRTAFLAGGPDQVGFYVDSYNSGFSHKVRLLSWKIT